MLASLSQVVSSTMPAVTLAFRFLVTVRSVDDVAVLVVNVGVSTILTKLLLKLALVVVTCSPTPVVSALAFIATPVPVVVELLLRVTPVPVTVVELAVMPLVPDCKVTGLVPIADPIARVVEELAVALLPIFIV